MSLWSRLTNVFRSGRVQRELDEELQFHIDERIRELTAAGMTRRGRGAGKWRAGSAARCGCASRASTSSCCPGSIRWCATSAWAARMLRKNAVVTGAAVVSLSLALGACVAAFSLVDALILRPLPVRQPEQLVYLTFPTDNPERPEADTFNDPAVRAPARRRARARRSVRDEHAGDAAGEVRRPGGEKEQVRTQYVSGDAFERLGVVPAAGRLLTRAGRPAAGRASGRGREPRVLAAAVRRRSRDRRPLVHARTPVRARGPSVPDRRRGRAAVHRRRAGPADGSCGCPTRCTTRGRSATSTSAGSASSGA